MRAVRSAQSRAAIGITPALKAWPYAAVMSNAEPLNRVQVEQMLHEGGCRASTNSIVGAVDGKLLACEALLADHAARAWKHRWNCSPQVASTAWSKGWTCSRCVPR